MNYIDGIAHIGIAVPNILEAKELFQLLGFSDCGEGVVDEVQHGVKALMMKNDGLTIEILSPLEEGKDSPIDSYISSKPYKIYHIAYYCTDFDAQIEELRQNRFMMTERPKRSETQRGRRTVFMANRKMGVIELIER